MPPQSNLNLGISTSIETYILPYVKEITSGNSWHGAGCSSLVLWDHLEGWGGLGSEKQVRDGRDMCVPMAHSC